MRSAAVSLAIMFASIGLVASSAAALHAPPPAPGDSGDTADDSGEDDTGDGEDSGGDTADSGDSGTDTSEPVDTSDSGDTADTADTDLPDIGAAELAGEKGGFGCSATVSGATAALAWTGLLVVAARGRRREDE